MMRTALALAVCLLVFLGSAAAEEKPAAKAPTARQAADKVLEALRAKDEAALRPLAEMDRPDPWLVADELCARGAFEAAKALAKAAPRPDLERLPAYVEAYEKSPAADTLRAAVEAANEHLQVRRYDQALAAVRAVEPTGSNVLVHRYHMTQAIAHRLRRRLPESAKAYRVAGNVARDLGWLAGQARCLDGEAFMRRYQGHWAAARDVWREARTLNRKRGATSDEAAALYMVGVMHRRLDDYEGALQRYEEARALYESVSDRAGIASVYNGIGVVHKVTGRPKDAITAYEKALRIREELGRSDPIAVSLNNLANAWKDVGRYEDALALHQRALAIREKNNDAAEIARTLHNIALLRELMGDYAQALELYERALKIRRRLERWPDIAMTVNNLGVVHMMMGDLRQARTFFDESAAIFERINPVRHLYTLANVAYVLRQEGEIEEAVMLYEQALAAAVKMGNPGFVAQMRANLAHVHVDLRKYGKAVPVYRDVLAVLDAHDDFAGAALIRNELGLALHAGGKPKEAIEAWRAALSAAERAGNTYELGRAHRNLAAVHLEAGDAKTALAHAEPALAAMRRLVRGHSQLSGASARGKWTELFEIGAFASLEAGNVAGAVRFLEEGRAGTLLEALQGGATVRGVVLPKALVLAEAQAQADVNVASEALRRARATNRLASVRSAKGALERARGALEEVVGRIQRKAKLAADVLYPSAASLDEIKGTLSANEALVVYGMFSTDALALVVTPTEARVVPLGDVKAVARKVEQLDVAKAGTTYEAATLALRKAVVDPLAIGKDVQRLLISPHGALAFVPFALLDVEREIVNVPSGTTYRVLRSAAPLRGAKVLALGDPDYRTRVTSRTRGGTLAPLPATRAEVTAIGDVVLLAKHATETTLGRRLRDQERWRAVHLACHGLVDTERPMLSRLAVTADNRSDGDLSLPEILRMQIPADLVVLSACETARGGVFEAEGVVGFARAFMLAGSPRVICSLWQVDDEATQALMIKFYELWNPKEGKGLGAAEALRKAQEHTRGHDKWKHPYFWAAWVLWGLPD